LGGIEVTQGTADISARSHEALGGTINYLTNLPAKERSFQLETSIKEFDGRRYSLRYDTGEFAWNTKA
jgi:hypothetical protein